MARPRGAMSNASRTPDKTDPRAVADVPSSRTEIDAFLSTARAVQPAGGRGRLIFALDATMSRQPTWDRACALQADMFEEAGRIGGLDVKLVYFRGFGECRASKWVGDARRLAELMTRIDCRGGHTQIRKVLSCAIEETRKQKVQALVYVGDCMEENVDELCARAGELGLLGVPAFLFQEGGDRDAEAAFREIARLTKGAYCPFNSASAKELGDLLKAVAAYAAGGRAALAALEKRGGAGARPLIEQMK
ncbi:VWA domain-containing protein [Polymorphum gilvum]|nr:VWA domain-containing protein [Polymorphum gilvum]